MKVIGSIFRYAGLGILIAGTYGILHDQVTFALAPEYFTKFKFDQFSYADFGWPDWAFAGTVGFLATWWLGMAAGWVIGRVLERKLGRPVKNRELLPPLLKILATTCAFGVIGYVLAALQVSPELQRWTILKEAGIDDVAAFLKVGTIHNLGYIGAVLGFAFVIFGIFKTPKD